MRSGSVLPQAFHRRLVAAGAGAVLGVLLFAGLVLAAALLGGTAIYLRIQTRDARVEQTRYFAAVADLKAAQVAEWYAVRLREAEQVGRGTLLQRQFRSFLAGGARAPSDRELLQWMEGVQDPVYQEVTLFDSQGRRRLSTAHLPDSPVAADDYPNLARGLRVRNVEVFDIHAVGGQPRLSMWVPIAPASHPDGRALGALYFRLDPERQLYPMLQTWPSAEASMETLLIRRGRDRVDCLIAPRGGGDADPGPALARLLDAGVAPRSAGGIGLLSGLDQRGVRVLAALRPIPGTPWQLLLKADQVELDAPLRHHNRTTGGLLLALLLLLGAGAGAVLRNREQARIRGELARERERQLLNERFNHVMQHANDIILLSSPEGIILEANEQACLRYGYPPGELCGMSIFALRAPAAAATFTSQFEQVRQGQALQFESEHRARDGSTFPVEVSSRQVDFAGAPFVISFVRDITERRRGLEAQARLEAQLRQSQKLESLGSLAGGVAHDMNNVLGAILSLASTLREQPNAQGVSALDTIVNACLRGRDVVRSLLYFAHKDLSEVTVVDLNQVVRDLVKLLAYTTLKRVKLDMDLQEDLGALDGDRPAISNALMNICVNAMDAMEGTGALAIRTRKLPSGLLELSVQDTGPGMSPEVLEKAVEPFFTTKPQGKGTGLGLAMVYATMQAHHGTLELQSRPGAGTRVVLTFPPSLAALPGAAPAPPAPAPQAALEILLVDDDELIRASVAPLLAMLGHRVQTAAGGLEAVRRMEAGLAPDLVILDMNMPGLNGADTLPRLLALRPDLPVLLATGYSDADLSHLIRDRPRLQSIQKPFSLDELRRKLKQMAVVPAG